jgi:cysteine desulfurase
MASAGRSYLDWNATAPLRAEASRAVVAALELAGNPSSIHAEGRAARATVEKAREQVARLVNALPRLVGFTSGGSEANVLCLTPTFRLGRQPDSAGLLMSATEHACVRDGHRFAAAAVIPVDDRGLVDLGWLEAELKRCSGPVLVSVHLANNETGVIQPIADMALICRQAGARLHVDAVQAAGKILIDMTTLGADAITLSAHKLGGPKGVGAVVFGSDTVEIGDRLIRGGGQEKGLRAGTENVAGIAGFGAAAEAAMAEIDAEGTRLADLRDRMEAGLRALAPDTQVFGAGAPRLPNTSCFATPGVKAETALILLDLAGVSVSSGSACSSGKVRESHVLAAMGVPPQVSGGALRVSLGRTTVADDVDRFLAAYTKVLAARAPRATQAAA